MEILDITKTIIIDPGSSTPNFESLLDLYGVRRKVKLLIVDDSYLCRKMVSQLLDKFSVECAEAVDGEDALAKISISLQEDGQGFDGIIMDGEMPRMNGLQAVKAIRQLGFTGRIYGCTGGTVPKLEASFIAHGADKTFLKPLTDKGFTALLRGKFSAIFYYGNLNVFYFIVDLSEFIIVSALGSSRP